VKAPVLRKSAPDLAVSRQTVHEDVVLEVGRVKVAGCFVKVVVVQEHVINGKATEETLDLLKNGIDRISDDSVRRDRLDKRSRGSGCRCWGRKVYHHLRPRWNRLDGECRGRWCTNVVCWVADPNLAGEPKRPKSVMYLW